jgi:hypothetical protein
MSDLIQLKRSSVANAAPATLADGELALNFRDGKLYYRNHTGAIVEFAGGGGGGGGGSLSGSVTIPASDPYWDSVMLLLRGDGNFTDSSKYARTLTAYGNAAATASGKYGTNSIALDGTGDYLSVSSSDFAWGASDFTIEAWVWLNAIGANGGIFSTFFSNGSPYGVSVFLNTAGVPVMMHPGGANISSSAAIATGQWVHIAAVRSSGTATMFVNGVSAGSVSASDSHGQSDVVIGRVYTELDNNYLNGRIAELRVTKAARYVANFTPPTAALPASVLSASPTTLPVTITGSGGGSGLSWSSVPASATATGTAGQIAYDGDYLYIATATNTWERAALSTWTPFTPASVSGLTTWLDGADASTLYDATSGGSLVSSGGSVARWQDKSGNGNHAVQSSSGARPTRGSGAIAFNGSSQFMSIPQSGLQFGTSAFSMFAVVKLTTLSSIASIVISQDDSASNGPILRLLAMGEQNALLTVRTPSASATNAATGNTFATGSYQLCEVSRASDVYSLRLNSGTAATMSVAGSLNLGVQVNIGANQAAADWWLNGSIGEIIMYSGSVSSGDRSQILAYLNAKWGMS